MFQQDINETHTYDMGNSFENIYDDQVYSQDGDDPMGYPPQSMPFERQQHSQDYPNNDRFINNKETIPKYNRMKTQNEQHSQSKGRANRSQSKQENHVIHTNMKSLKTSLFNKDFIPLQNVYSYLPEKLKKEIDSQAFRESASNKLTVQKQLKDLIEKEGQIQHEDINDINRILSKYELKQLSIEETMNQQDDLKEEQNDVQVIKEETFNLHEHLQKKYAMQTMHTDQLLFEKMTFAEKLVSLQQDVLQHEVVFPFINQKKPEMVEKGIALYKKLKDEPRKEKKFKQVSSTKSLSKILKRAYSHASPQHTKLNNLLSKFHRHMDVPTPRSISVMIDELYDILKKESPNLLLEENNESIENRVEKAIESLKPLHFYLKKHVWDALQALLLQLLSMFSERIINTRSSIHFRLRMIDFIHVFTGNLIETYPDDVSKFIVSQHRMTSWRPFGMVLPYTDKDNIHYYPKLLSFNQGLVQWYTLPNFTNFKEDEHVLEDIQNYLLSFNMDHPLHLPHKKINIMTLVDIDEDEKLVYKSPLNQHIIKGLPEELQSLVVRTFLNEQFPEAFQLYEQAPRSTDLHFVHYFNRLSSQFLEDDPIHPIFSKVAMLPQYLFPIDVEGSDILNDLMKDIGTALKGQFKELVSLNASSIPIKMLCSHHDLSMLTQLFFNDLSSGYKLNEDYVTNDDNNNLLTFTSNFTEEDKKILNDPLRILQTHQKTKGVASRFWRLVRESYAIHDKQLEQPALPKMDDYEYCNLFLDHLELLYHINHINIKEHQSDSWDTKKKLSKEQIHHLADQLCLNWIDTDDYYHDVYFKKSPHMGNETLLELPQKTGLKRVVQKEELSSLDRTNIMMEYDAIRQELLGIHENPSKSSEPLDFGPLLNRYIIRHVHLSSEKERKVYLNWLLPQLREANVLLHRHKEFDMETRFHHSIANQQVAKSLSQSLKRLTMSMINDDLRINEDDLNQLQLNIIFAKQLYCQPKQLLLTKTFKSLSNEEMEFWKDVYKQRDTLTPQSSFLYQRLFYVCQHASTEERALPEEWGLIKLLVLSRSFVPIGIQWLLQNIPSEHHDSELFQLLFFRLQLGIPSKDNKKRRLYEHIDSVRRTIKTSPTMTSLIQGIFNVFQKIHNKVETTTILEVLTLSLIRQSFPVVQQSVSCLQSRELTDSFFHGLICILTSSLPHTSSSIFQLLTTLIYKKLLSDPKKALRRVTTMLINYVYTDLRECPTYSEHQQPLVPFTSFSFQQRLSFLLSLLSCQREERQLMYAHLQSWYFNENPSEILNRLPSTPSLSILSSDSINCLLDHHKRLPLIIEESSKEAIHLNLKTQYMIYRMTGNFKKAYWIQYFLSQFSTPESWLFASLAQNHTSWTSNSFSNLFSETLFKEKDASHSLFVPSFLSHQEDSSQNWLAMLSKRHLKLHPCLQTHLMLALRDTVSKKQPLYFKILQTCDFMMVHPRFHCPLLYKLYCSSRLVYRSLFEMLNESIQQQSMSPGMLELCQLDTKLLQQQQHRLQKEIANVKWVRRLSEWMASKEPSFIKKKITQLVHHITLLNYRRDRVLENDRLPYYREIQSIERCLYWLHRLSQHPLDINQLSLMIIRLQCNSIKVDTLLSLKQLVLSSETCQLWKHIKKMMPAFEEVVFNQVQKVQEPVRAFVSYQLLYAYELHDNPWIQLESFHDLCALLFFSMHANLLLQLSPSQWDALNDSISIARSLGTPQAFYMMQDLSKISLSKEDLQLYIPLYRFSTTCTFLSLDDHSPLSENSFDHLFILCQCRNMINYGFSSCLRYIKKALLSLPNGVPETLSDYLSLEEFPLTNGSSFRLFFFILQHGCELSSQLMMTHTQHPHCATVYFLATHLEESLSHVFPHFLNLIKTTFALKGCSLQEADLLGFLSEYQRWASFFTLPTSTTTLDTLSFLRLSNELAPSLNIQPFVIWQLSCVTQFAPYVPQIALVQQRIALKEKELFKVNPLLSQFHNLMNDHPSLLSCLVSTSWSSFKPLFSSSTIDVSLDFDFPMFPRDSSTANEISLESSSSARQLFSILLTFSASHSTFDHVAYCICLFSSHVDTHSFALTLLSRYPLSPSFLLIAIENVLMCPRLVDDLLLRLLSSHLDTSSSLLDHFQYSVSIAIRCLNDRPAFFDVVCQHLSSLTLSFSFLDVSSPTPSFILLSSYFVFHQSSDVPSNPDALNAFLLWFHEVMPSFSLSSINTNARFNGMLEQLFYTLLRLLVDFPLSDKRLLVQTLSSFRSSFPSLFHSALFGEFCSNF